MAENISVGHVTCPATITSPAPSPGFTAATGLGANERCGAQVAVNLPSDFPLAGNWVVICRCPHGHQFYAGAKDLE
jgi:hypothetical protein